MNLFKTYYLDVLKKQYINFSGRATRKHYWMFVLFNIIVFAVLAFVLSFLGNTGNVLYYLCNLAVLLPSLAIAVRRLHDIDFSGWWLLLVCIPFLGSLIVLVLLLLPSTQGANRFDK